MTSIAELWPRLRAPPAEELPSADTVGAVAEAMLAGCLGAIDAIG
jgi:hypothetical protein